METEIKTWEKMEIKSRKRDISKGSGIPIKTNARTKQNEDLDAAFLALCNISQAYP